MRKAQDLDGRFTMPPVPGSSRFVHEKAFFRDRAAERREPVISVALLRHSAVDRSGKLVRLHLGDALGRTVAVQNDGCPDGFGIFGTPINFDPGTIGGGGATRPGAATRLADVLSRAVYGNRLRYLVLPLRLLSRFCRSQGCLHSGHQPVREAAADRDAHTGVYDRGTRKFKDELLRSISGCSRRHIVAPSSIRGTGSYERRRFATCIADRRIRFRSTGFASGTGDQYQSKQANSYGQDEFVLRTIRIERILAWVTSVAPHRSMPSITISPRLPLPAFRVEVRSATTLDQKEDEIGE